MAVAVVVFNGTRVDSLDTNSDTGHWGGSGPVPSAEAQNAYQNSLCVNKLSDATGFEGIDFDPGSGALDMTLAANRLWFVKVYVNDSFDVNATFGVAAGIGSANNAFYKYNIAGSGAKLAVYDKYPAQGGYILTAIDPNIVAWRDGSGTGSPSLTAVDWFGVQSAMINGNAKSENLAFDAIDVGTGLTITAGDGGSDEGTFTDFVAADQDAPTIRWGCVRGTGNNVTAWCLLTVGTASVTEFLDTESIVIFSDGYHSAGLVGVAVGCSHADSIIQIDSLFIGEGTRNGVDANDTRPDFVVTGTSGTFDSAATMRNFRNITFTSICDVVDAELECQLLVQASCNISDSIIKTNALTSVACLQDPTFGTITDLHDVEFIQTGVGHAIEIDTDTSYTFTNITFTGYGVDTADDAALDVTASSGTVTITVVGGNSPTFKTAGAAVVIINDINITISNLRDDTEVRVMTAGTDTELAGIEDATDGSADARTFTFALAQSTVIDIFIVNKTYENIEIYAYTIPSTDQILLQQQRFDRNYLNP